MCGRYTLAGPDPSSLRDRFGIGESVQIRRRYNVAPGDDVLAVTTDREGAPRGQVLRWGLVPHWAKDPKALGLKLINARSETMAEKPSFRDAVERRRCLVIADGFYEWEKRSSRVRGAKQPWWITRADHEPFAFAGLWATWRPAPRRRAAADADDRHHAGQRAARADPRPHAGDARPCRRGGVAEPRHAARAGARPVPPARAHRDARGRPGRRRRAPRRARLPGPRPGRAQPV